LLQNSTDIEFLQKVKRFILKEMDTDVSSPKNSDLLNLNSSTGLNNVENESLLRFRKLLKFGQITRNILDLHLK
jgi:hypothetical protein